MSATTKSITAAWTVQHLKRNLARVLSPRVAQDVLHALEREEAGFARIAELLSRDPYITAKVVALANLIRGPNRPAILSLDRAVQVLGTRNVRSLVLSVMLTGPLLSPDANVPRRRDLWRWVLACAVAGGRVGELAAVDNSNDPENLDGTGDSACGLVMGLGALILFAGLGLDYGAVLGATLRPMDLSKREEKTLGLNHHQITLWALQSLYCISELGSFSAALNDPQDNPLRLRARIVEVLAARIAGYESARAEAWLLDAMPRLGIDPGLVLGENLADLRARLRRMAGALDVELDDWREQEDERQETLLAAGEALEGLLVDTLSLAESIGDGLAEDASQVVAAVESERGIDADPLTNLLNRRGWDHHRGALAQQGSRKLGLLMTDIDRFKAINDTLGHVAGDEVLKTVARAMRGVNPSPLILARLGGDEFAAVYPVQSVAELSALAAAVSAALRRESGLGTGGQVTVSAGGLVVTARRLAGEWSRTYVRADSLLYQAKRRGRDQAVMDDATAVAAED